LLDPAGPGRRRRGNRARPVLRAAQGARPSRPPKPAKARTTNSRHSLPVFRNRFSGKEFTAPNQAYVSDLAYIRTNEGFLYAALITDAYSRKIVGSHIGDSLEAEGCIRALDKALKALPPDARPLHHSDRGSQYCCHAYVERLQSRGLGSA
jgi:putative transposase